MRGDEQTSVLCAQLSCGKFGEVVSDFISISIFCTCGLYWKHIAFMIPLGRIRGMGYCSRGGQREFFSLRLLVLCGFLSERVFFPQSVALQRYTCSWSQAVIACCVGAYKERNCRIPAQRSSVSALFLL